MSKLSKKSGASAVGNLMSGIKSALTNGGKTIINDHNAKAVLALESMDVSSQAFAEVGNSQEVFSEGAKQAYAQAFGLNPSEISEAIPETALESAFIALQGTINPNGYSEKITKPNTTGAHMVVAMPQGGAYGDYATAQRVAYSEEAFDTSHLLDLQTNTATYNILTARQDPFAEGFFPTTVLTPDQTGLKVAINRTMVFTGIHHQLSGNTEQWNKRHLLDAFRDPTILENETTKLIPYFKDGENNEAFVDPALVAPWNVEDPNDKSLSFPTNFLAVDQDIDFMGLCQTPGTVRNGVFNNTDQIDRRAALDQVLVKIGDSAIAIKVSDLARTQFLKSQEGDGREATLTFLSEDIFLSKDTKQVDGSDVPELAAITAANMKVRIRLQLSGHMSHERGYVTLAIAKPKVKAVLDAQGTALAIKDDPAKTAIAAFIDKMEVVGYSLTANRSNSNLRTQGLLVDASLWEEVYLIATQAPITALSPAANADPVVQMTALVNTTHVRISNQAVTTLLNYADVLRKIYTPGAEQPEFTGYEGIGRYLIKPYFKEDTLDLVAALANVSSAAKNNDISGCIVGRLKDEAATMAREMGYQQALNMMNGGAEEKMHVAVGTDQRLPQWIMQAGDDRTLGPKIDYTIYSTADIRMDDKIVMAFVRKNRGNSGIDPLSFGTFAYCPEIVTNITLTRDNETHREMSVRPVNRHIPNLPGMVILNVKGLSEVIEKRAGQGAIDGIVEINDTTPPTTP